MVEPGVAVAPPSLFESERSVAAQPRVPVRLAVSKTVSARGGEDLGGSRDLNGSTCNTGVDAGGVESEVVAGARIRSSAGEVNDRDGLVVAIADDAGFCAVGADRAVDVDAAPLEGPVRRRVRRHRHASGDAGARRFLRVEDGSAEANHFVAVDQTVLVGVVKIHEAQPQLGIGIGLRAGRQQDQGGGEGGRHERAGAH